uniref:ATP-dependent RNA helicase n=1 Tax=Hirondellea gigas TaxID=1518452 RepID=A0A2P2I6E4_9CRUS
MWKVQRKKIKQSKEENEREVLILEKQIQELKHKDPQTLTRFNKFPISKNTLRAMKVCKFIHPTLVQQLVLPHALQGVDVVVDAKTGSGKTLAFVIPMVEALYRACWCRSWGLAAIIVAPTRELAYQVHEVVKRIIQFHKFTSALIIGGKDLAAEYHHIGGFNILVCTPGRLHQHVEQSPNFNVSTLKLFVIDEADLCLSMGFADMMNTILRELPRERQTMLFSATQTRNINTLIKSGCTKPVFCSTDEYAPAATPSKLKQSYSICEAHDKIAYIFSFLKYYKKKKVLVFLSTCKQVKFLSAVLSSLKHGRKVLDMHGCMKQHLRMKIYNLFQSEKNCVMIATDIASRGLDFSGVEWVVSLDCPENVTTYIHRVGRTARYFGEGEALLLLTQRESDAMIAQLCQHRVPLQHLEVESGMLSRLDSRVEDVLLKKPEVLAMAQRAFKAYLKNLHYMKNKDVFDAESIDRDRLARSYGLVTTPQVKFVECLIKEEEQQQFAQVYKTYGGAAEESAVDDLTNNNNSGLDGTSNASHNGSYDADSDDEEGQDESDGSKSNDQTKENVLENTSSLARAYYKNDSVKRAAIIAKECPYKERFEELFVTVSELSGALAEPPKDYSKYLLKVKKKPGDDDSQTDHQTCQESSSCLTLSGVKAIVERYRKQNKLSHKRKLKERRWETTRKRQEKKGGKKHEKADKTAGSDEDDSDGELDPFTQQIIDELPDPDEIRRRKGRENEQQQDGSSDEFFNTSGGYVEGDNSGVHIKRKMDKRKREPSNREEDKFCKRLHVEDSDGAESCSSDGGSDQDYGSDSDRARGSSLHGLSLQQQEDLALKLLMGTS